MATWKVAPGVKDRNLSGGIRYDANESVHQSHWQFQQNEKPYLEEVKRDRELDAMGHWRHTGFRKMCTIPDIVAIELLTKYHLDIHDTEFMGDKNNLKRLKKIIQQDFPHLLIAT